VAPLPARSLSRSAEECRDLDLGRNASHFLMSLYQLDVEDFLSFSHEVGSNEDGSLGNNFDDDFGYHGGQNVIVSATSGCAGCGRS
jgi:hypothetical protein